MKSLFIKWKKKFFRFLPIFFLTLPQNNLFSGEFNPHPKLGNGFIKCDDGRFALIPEQNNFYIDNVSNFYKAVSSPNPDSSQKNIKDSIASVTSYIYPYKSISIDKNWEITPFVNRENADDDDYSRNGYWSAFRNDWYTADKFLKIYNLPTNNKTYKFTLYESNKLKKVSFSSNEAGQLQSTHIIIDLAHQNQEGKKLSIISLIEGPQKGNFYIKDDTGKIYNGLISNFDNNFKNEYGYIPGAQQIVESIFCPKDLTKEITIRNVFALGISISNMVGEVKEKYVGLQVIQANLKTSNNSPTEKQFNQGFPSF